MSQRQAQLQVEANTNNELISFSVGSTGKVQLTSPLDLIRLCHDRQKAYSRSS